MTNSTRKLNKTNSLLAAAAIGAAMFAALPAQAAWMDRGLTETSHGNIVAVHSRQRSHDHSGYGQYRGGYTLKSPREIRYSLRDQGLRRISDIYYRSNREVYVATGWSRGRLLKVAVNPYTGNILRSRVLRAANPGHGSHDYYRGYRHHGSHGGFTMHGSGGSIRFRW